MVIDVITCILIINKVVSHYNSNLTKEKINDSFIHRFIEQQRQDTGSNPPRSISVVLY